MTDEALQIIVEMNRWLCERFKRVLEEMTPEEASWRPLPHANNINVIIRHLRIEAEWHVAGLERGEPMPVEVTASDQHLIDSVPLDYERNLNELETLYKRFVAGLAEMTSSELRQRTEMAYRDSPREHPAHLLAFHQAVHLAGHLGQISTIRNLYRRSRGEPARFFPDNPTFPKS